MVADFGEIILDSETVYNNFRFTIASFDIANFQGFHKKNWGQFYQCQMSLEGYLFL